MSTSPTRYYASKPASRPTSPPTPAELRSQAIAKLKRAASLPRTPAGRRPSQNQGVTPDDVRDNLTPNTHHHSEVSSASPSPAPGLMVSPTHYDGQEVLSPSPVASSFDHSSLFPGSSSMTMQRSLSASSSFQLPTSSAMSYASSNNSHYVSASSSPTPDWAAMQLAQSYLPSLSPIGLPPSSFPTQSFNPNGTPTQHTGMAFGRNTPSPLPSLGELRTLQRSNSAAARAHAMSKLTGGRNTPSDEDHGLVHSSSRPNLQRADSLGTARLLGVPVTNRAVVQEKEVEQVQEDKADGSRPRLQRSFTVSSSNMGEERRSAVGRRMVARLGERKAARQKEEDEVRQLWEERRAAAGSQEGTPRIEQEELAYPAAPLVNGPSPVPPSVEALEGNQHYPVQDYLDTLHLPERTISRGTMRSAGEAFEYDAHLRRSLSSRTARGAVGTVPEVTSGSLEERVGQGYGSEQLEDEQDAAEPGYYELDDELAPPQPLFATPTRHAQHDSTSTNGTVHGSQSPGASSTLSRDGLGSMMFILGGAVGGGPVDAARRGEGSWPAEVGENGSSDWGTPAKDVNQPVYDESPLARSPLSSTYLHSAPNPQPPNTMHQIISDDAVFEEDETHGQPLPPTRSSTMSWEEVGGPADQEVPSDTHYHKKSGSISAKIGRNIRTVMRKHSQSRSSVTSSSSPPTSPKLGFTGFPRRGSEASLSPSQASAVRSLRRGSTNTQAENVRHQPSMSSLAPSVPESSANSVLLQHQISGDPLLNSYLPRAELSDPRIHSSKLSPFPGIAQLEKQTATSTNQQLQPPKLLHQTSDSVVPSQQRVTPAPAGAESIYSLPLPTSTNPDDNSRRGSVDSVNKRSWLSKAFGQQTSPRSSMSRKLSITDTYTSSRKASINEEEADPFAAPPPPTLLTVKPLRHRSASPSVSVVPEGSEEGSRLTRFTVGTGKVDGSPLVEEDEDEVHKGGKDKEVLPQKSVEVLERMNLLIGMEQDDPGRPEILDDPPRKLLLATQVLQVVNLQTAKDRFLFLFNDILVITKPLITQGKTATLSMKHIVKSIVSLEKLYVSTIADPTHPEIQTPRNAVVEEFVQQFAKDPKSACNHLVEISKPRIDVTTLASLIFRTSELDKSQIGNLLAGNPELLEKFMERFHFLDIRLDEALRMFLLAVRIPAHPDTSDVLLRGFAHRYSVVNKGDEKLVYDLVKSIIQLNDAWYGMYGFSTPNHAVTFDVWVGSLVGRGAWDVGVLRGIYEGIKRGKLDQALSGDEVGLERKIEVEPKIPGRLTSGEWFDVRVRIDGPDDKFRVRLLDEGLDFEPGVLDFAKSGEVRFRFRSMGLGVKSILFDRIGAHAPLYAGLGNTRSISIERSFMRHTFQVAFQSHTGQRRKYCFSVNDPETLSKWTRGLVRQMSVTRTSKVTGNISVIRKAAEGVALQVLRDALIASVDGEKGKSARSGSVSAVLGGNEGDGDTGAVAEDGNVVGGGGGGGMMDVQTGKELVLVCRQNSLLPGLLELLQAGVGDGAVVVDTKGLMRQDTTKSTNGVLGRMMSTKGRSAGGRI